MLDDGQYKYFKFFSHLVSHFNVKNKIAATAAAVADVFLLYDRGISILSKKTDQNTQHHLMMKKK